MPLGMFVVISRFGDRELFALTNQAIWINHIT